MRPEDRTRIARMLEQDKEEMNTESRAAALRDFEHVAREYFELDGAPTLDVQKQRHGFEATLVIRAFRVKNFTVVK